MVFIPSLTVSRVKLSAIARGALLPRPLAPITEKLSTFVDFPKDL